MVSGVKGERTCLSLGTPRGLTGTETFAALKLMIDNWRWADVPFTCGLATLTQARD